MKDGGAAFPNPDRANPFTPAAPGMSLRDWFAGQALPMIGSVLSHSNKLTLRGEPLSTFSEEHLAKTAYAIADAMLAEREKGVSA